MINLFYSQKNFFTAENAEYTEESINKIEKAYINDFNAEKITHYYYRFISATSAVKFMKSLGKAQNLKKINEIC
jgi:hypothetical protein